VRVSRDVCGNRVPGQSEHNAVVADILFPEGQCGVIISMCGRAICKDSAKGRRLRSNVMVSRTRPPSAGPCAFGRYKSKKKEKDGEIVSIEVNPRERGSCTNMQRPICRHIGSAIQKCCGASRRVRYSSRKADSIPATVLGGSSSTSADDTYRPHAAGQGGASWSSLAFAPCVDENWLALG